MWEENRAMRERAGVGGNQGMRERADNGGKWGIRDRTEERGNWRRRKMGNGGHSRGGMKIEN